VAICIASPLSLKHYPSLSRQGLAAVLASLDECDSAVNLDGGGSSAMWISSRGIVNTPSDGLEREIVSALAVFSSAV